MIAAMWALYYEHNNSFCSSDDEIFISLLRSVALRRDDTRNWMNQISEHAKLKLQFQPSASLIMLLTVLTVLTEHDEKTTNYSWVTK